MKHPKKMEPMMAPPPEMQRMMSMMHGSKGEEKAPPKKMPMKEDMKNASQKRK